MVLRFLSGSKSGEDRHGTAPSFEAARAAFEAARRDYLPKRTEADFEAWRRQRDWIAEKYRRFDRGERMLPDWRVPRLRREAASALTWVKRE